MKAEALVIKIIAKPKDSTPLQEKMIHAVLFAQWDAMTANVRVKRIEDALRQGRLPTVEELDAVLGKAMLDELRDQFHKLGTGFVVETGTKDESAESDEAL